MAIAVAVVAATSSQLAAPSAALAAQDEGSLMIRPITGDALAVTVVPGTAATLTVRVMNVRSDVKLRARLAASTDAGADVASWLTPTVDVVMIDPNAHQDVDVRVSVPVGTPAGRREVGVSAHIEAAEPIDGGPGSGTVVTERDAWAPVTIEVAGAPAARLTISTPRVELQDGAAEAVVPVRNAGSAAASGTGSLRLDGLGAPIAFAVPELAAGADTEVRVALPAGAARALLGPGAVTIEYAGNTAMWRGQVPIPDVPTSVVTPVEPLTTPDDVTPSWWTQPLDQPWSGPALVVLAVTLAGMILRRRRQRSGGQLAPEATPAPVSPPMVPIAAPGLATVDASDPRMTHLATALGVLAEELSSLRMENQRLRDTSPGPVPAPTSAAVAPMAPLPPPTPPTPPTPVAPSSSPSSARAAAELVARLRTTAGGRADRPEVAIDRLAAGDASRDDVRLALGPSGIEVVRSEIIRRVRAGAAEDTRCPTGLAVAIASYGLDREPPAELVVRLLDLADGERLRAAGPGAALGGDRWGDWVMANVVLVALGSPSGRLLRERIALTPTATARR